METSDFSEHIHVKIVQLQTKLNELQLELTYIKENLDKNTLQSILESFLILSNQLTSLQLLLLTKNKI